MRKTVGPVRRKTGHSFQSVIELQLNWLPHISNARGLLVMNQTLSTISSNRGRILSLVLTGGLLAALAGFLYWFLACPCERTPGGYLLGEESRETITDWSFVNEVPLCQIQTRVFLLPHSLNLNCSAMDGELFIGCMNCEEKRWGAALTDQGAARIRINGTVYPVAARRLTDVTEKDRAWLSSSIKAERPLDTPRPPDNIWWTFQLSSIGAG